ncbi:hypothetical protein [Terasakiella pusilla]|uniref:hypothetical protein n=1 Tax=Terasakiella pusilla TaxID=64973 RepID=UPI003AA93562
MEEKKTGPARRRRRRKTRLLETVRQELERTLPTYIHDAVISYEGFLDSPLPEDAKGFAAYHSACKAALTHVEVLAKLMRWCENTPEVVAAHVHSEGEEIADLLAGARAALQELEG